MSEVVFTNFYHSQIKKITNDENIINLFSELPSSSIYAYKKTLIYNATKNYINSNSVLPNNFFALIEQNLKSNGVLRTYKLYENEFSKMENFFNFEKKYIIDILKNLNNTTNSEIRYKAVEQIKDLIRNYNSKYKGHYIKMYVDKSLKNLKNICYRKEKETIHSKDLKINYSFKRFIKEIKENNPKLYNKILEYMENTSNVFIDDIEDDVFTAIDEEANIDTFLNLFGIYKPFNYNEDYIKMCKITNRLRDSYEPILNKSNDIEYKKLLIKYINDKIDGNNTSDTYDKITTNDKMNIEVLYHLLNKANTYALLENDKIVLKTNIIIDDKRKQKYKNFEIQLNNVNKFINYVKKQWLIEKKKKASIYQIEQEDNYNDVLFDDNSYVINTESYIHYNLLNELIEGIDKNKLNNLSKEEFQSLNNLLNKNNLLFTYLIGNITKEDILLIINNYSSITYHLKKYEPTINNIEEMLRIAKTFTLVNDLEIALIGYDNLIKIINYNQFAGLDVTDETIKLRIKKAVYLEVKSELINKSSLPYDISVKKDNLTLERYLNNDPDALVSGIETKTCFFISVNENDFFFYSLLNKNGFIVKIIDEKGDFIARASCFRRNNILMINGIRLKNNDIYPKNKEQKDTIKKVVTLIEMMSEKLIYSTTADTCPIDYVLCNKAGILENSDYDNRYEMVDFKLIREPIDIYNNDWQEFIKINDEDENMLQEAPINPNTSFTTDFGENYPTILIKSRNNMGLLKPSDVSLKDQEACYIRPKNNTKVYVPEEITPNILAKINRIRALHTYIKSHKEKKPLQDNFQLIKSTDNISKIILSDDWVGIIYKDGIKEFAYTNYNNLEISEVQKYASFKDTISKELKNTRKLRPLKKA